MVSKPSQKLLDMCHIVSLSWQLEILPSQADVFKKGTWASQMLSPSTGGGTTHKIIFLMFISTLKKSNIVPII